MTGQKWLPGGLRYLANARGRESWTQLPLWV